MKTPFLAFAMILPLLASAARWPAAAEHKAHQSNKPSDDDAIPLARQRRMCVYEQAADIVTCYPGPYSSPLFFTLRLVRRPS